MQKLQERDIEKYIGLKKKATLILEFDQTHNVYLVSIRLSKNSDPTHIYTQRGSIKSFKSLERAIHWGEDYELSEAIVTHKYSAK